MLASGLLKIINKVVIPLLKGKLETYHELKNLCSIIYYNVELIKESCSFENQGMYTITKKEFEAYIELMTVYKSSCDIILSTWESDRFNSINSFVGKINPFITYYDRYFKDKNNRNYESLLSIFDSIKENTYEIKINYIYDSLGPQQ